MGFSLRNLVKHIGADINPFDGPQAAPAPPQPASTARPQPQGRQQFTVRPVSTPKLTTPPPLPAPTILPPVTVAQPKNLQVGNTTVAPNPNARSGVAAPVLKSSSIDNAKAFDAGAASSAVRGLGDVAHSLDLLRAVTPNFVPGVSRYIDPLIKKTADTAQKPFDAGANAVDQIAKENNLYFNPSTEKAKHLGNAFGSIDAAIATGGGQVVGDAARLAKATPEIIRNAPEIAANAADAGRQVVAHTTGLVSPKFAGLTKDQVIMDPNKLNTLHQALTADEYMTVPEQQSVINGLHDIKNTHGHDFISGSPADRKQRIAQFLEQNGEAIPEYQKYLDRPSLATDELGAVGKNIRNDAEDPMTPIGDVLANKKAQFAERAGIAKPSEQTALPIAGADINVADQAIKPKAVINKFTKGAQDGRQNVSPEVQAAVQGEHARRSTQQLYDDASTAADQLGIDKTIQQAHEALAVKPGAIDDKTVAFAQQAIERADAEGRLDDAVGIHDALSEHLVKLGQNVQAASLLYKLSPRGILFKGLRDIKKGGNEVTPELQAKLSGLADGIANAEKGDAKDFAVAEFKKAVADSIPKSKFQGALSVWKAGLLSGVKTQGGNFESNATFAAARNAFANPVAAGVDKLLSFVTGERTKTATLRGLGSGAKEGSKKGLNTLKTGIDQRNISADKYELHGELNFKNPIINKVVAGPTNLVFRAMSAADQPFYYSAFKNSLYDQAKAAGLNAGLKGKSLAEHMNKLADSPTEKMANIARKDAEKSVLSQDSKLASAISAFGNKIPVAQAIVPFVKVPTNFLTRTLDYTPVGAVKTIVKGLAGKAGKGEGVTQRQLSEAIGEATTGTALIYLGAELTNHKLLSGDYPTSDPKEQARWKAEGITPNSVKVGNQWVSLNYLGPIGLLFGAGKNYQDAAARGDNPTMSAITGTGKNLTGQSFLTGLNNFANALNNPQRYAQAVEQQYAGSVVPNIVNDAANLGDNNQREVNSNADSIKSRIPGARNTLPVKQDVYGEDLNQRSSKLNVLVNPLRPSDAVTNDVKTEVARLHNVDPNNKDLQVTPTAVEKKITVSGNSVRLTPTQRHDLQKAVGQETEKNWDRLIKMPEYQALTDAEKAAQLDDLRKASAEEAQRQFVVSNNLGTYDKAASAKAVQAQAGNLNSFTTASKEGSGNQTPISDKIDAHSKKLLGEYNGLDDATRKKKAYGENDYDYKIEQAKLTNDIANGSLSRAQQIKRQDSVAKAKVGSAFSKDTREFFDLNKDDLAQLVENDKDGNATAQKVIAYDQALTAAGIQAKNKFKNGIITSGKGVGSSGSLSGKKAVSDFITRTRSTNDLGIKNQGELAALIKNAESSKKAVGKKLQTSNVALKRQTIKKQKAKVA